MKNNIRFYILGGSFLLAFTILGYFLIKTLEPRKIFMKEIGSEKDQLEVMATTSDHRIIMVMGDKFCTEPPPDTASSISSEIAALIGLSNEKEGKPNIDLSGSSAAEVLQLMHRTQGLQLLRDGMFYYCQLYLNGAITQEVYVKVTSSLFADAFKLITFEIYTDSSAYKLTNKGTEKGKK